MLIAPGFLLHSIAIEEDKKQITRSPETKKQNKLRLLEFLKPDIDKWQEIFASLQRHKLRTFLTALSVWWGIFMLVILLGAGNGLRNSAEADFGDRAKNRLYMWSNKTSIPYKGLPAGRFIEFNQKDYELLEGKKGADFNHVSGQYWMRGEFFTNYKNKSRSYNIQCVYPDHLHIEKPNLTDGRFINNIDIDERRKVAVIGSAVAKEFFGEIEEPLEKYIKIKGIEYQVVGVFTKERFRDTERIYLPISTAQQIDGTDHLGNLVVDLNVETVEESKVAEDQIRSDLAAYHKFDPNDEMAVGMWNSVEGAQDAKIMLRFIFIFIWLVGIGSIIAGVIGVSNIMLIIVKERTKEIGVRKALGATPSSIISMIVYEAVFLTSLAGYLGLACGLGLVYGIQQFIIANEIEAEFFKNPEVDLGTIMGAMFILVASGVISGLIPALQAVRINPVIAMKS